ncbi:CARDB domain-containing protein [Vulgatibacter incomptus]|uniref:CARDB domain-containing protein n=1 Tax=Vulgatibacter incomptus TaxID=1391653 RepID=UPI00067F90F5|nr:CARDB domain-containing protein [Vulgatibacter incomptus]
MSFTHSVDGKPFVGALLVLALVALPGAASAAYYTAIQTPNTFQAMPLPNGAAVTSYGSSQFKGWSYSPNELPITLPFQVGFFGQSYGVANVLGKGMLTFGTQYPTTGSGSSGQRAIPSTSTTPHNFVAVWWDQIVCNDTSGSDAGGPIQTQVIGTAPSRNFVIQWTTCRRYAGSGVFTAQVWLTEGSDEIAVHYGPVTGSGSTSWSASMGIENLDGSDGTFGPSASGQNCNPTCGPTNFPTNTKVTYSSGPSLAVQSVTAPTETFTGLPISVSAVVKNQGGKPAQGFTARVLVNTEPALTSSARELAVDSGTYDAAPGQTVAFDFEVRLPVDLQEGTYYVLVEADPFRQVPQSSRASSVRSTAPISVGVRAANLTVPLVSAPEQIELGAEFTVDWVAANIGNLEADAAPYIVVLSDHANPGSSSLVLRAGEVDLDMFSEVPMRETLRLPAGVEAGRYYVGVVFDPEARVFQHERNNNTGVSKPVLVASSALSVETRVLPEAALGAPYCVVLKAKGGDGLYVWSLEAGSKLPPGLVLEESPKGNRAKGLPFQTLLCGAPSGIGTFDFRLAVESYGRRATGDLQLTVGGSALTLQIAETSLPAAAFGIAYDTRLTAVGGTAPFTWTLVRGLPAGLTMNAAGRITGTPMEDGGFEPTVRVVDSEGRTAEQTLTLPVIGPANVVCATTGLPSRKVGESMDGIAILAAGGKKPYAWKTISSQRLGSGAGTTSEMFDGQAPKGLTLSQGGQVGGAPKEEGSYLWTVEVADADHGSRRCVLTMDVSGERNLSVSTLTLPTAAVGTAYSAWLQATGGSGSLTWSAFDRGLPVGLELDSSGRISGTPTLDQLDGESSRTFSFVVSVRDEQNRRGLAALSIRLLSEAPIAPVARAESKSGCQAGASDPSLAALALALGIGGFLRRRGTRAA